MFSFDVSELNVVENKHFLRCVFHFRKMGKCNAAKKSSIEEKAEEEEF